MEITELKKILDNHNLWLQTNGERGERANLRGADLCGVDLRYANLNNANLYGANLNDANLCGANLNNANLCYADLRYTDLYNAKLNNANLCGADLRGADLRYANLRDADLHGADLDFSAAPLWCGSLDIHIDDRQAKQLLYHLVRNVQYSKNTTKAMKKSLLMKTILKKANEFHRIGENNIKEIKGEKE